jgi:hypothetical protein
VSFAESLMPRFPPDSTRTGVGATDYSRMRRSWFARIKHCEMARLNLDRLRRSIAAFWGGDERPMPMAGHVGSQILVLATIVRWARVGKPAVGSRQPPRPKRSLDPNRTHPQLKVGSPQLRR